MDGRFSSTNFGARDLVINGTVQSPGWTGSELSYQYNGYLIKLSFTCEEFINAYYSQYHENWEDWIFGEYGGSQSQAQNLGYSIWQDINEIFWDNDGAEGYCWSYGDSQPPIKTNNYAYWYSSCLLYTSPSPRDQRGARMPSSA